MNIAIPLRSPLTLVLAVVRVVTFCAAQERPEWAKSLPNLPVRPEYYQGLGMAHSTGDQEADWQKAVGQARAQILAQLRVRVVSTVARRIEESGAGDHRTLREAFTATTDQMTEGTLEDLAIDRWFNEQESTLFAYAAVSKPELERRFNDKIQDAVSSARIFRTGAKMAVAKGDIAQALAQYLQAAKVVALAEFFLGKVVAGDIEGTGTSKPGLPLLQSELCGLLGNIHFQALVGNDQPAERGRALAQPLIGKVLYESAGTRIPVRNTLVFATFVSPAQGEVSGDARTDDEGAFRIAVTEVRAGQAESRVRVGIAAEGIDALAKKMPDAVRCWTGTFLDFTYRLKTRTTVTIAMHILEMNLDQQRAKSSVQEEIQKSLIGDRYTLVEESRVFRTLPEEKMNSAIRSGNFDPVVQALAKIADVVVVGLVSTKERSNPTAGIYLSTGSVSIRAIDTKTGQILAAVTVENEKEGGGSYELAGVRLIQRVGNHVGEELKTGIDRALK